MAKKTELDSVRFNPIEQLFLRVTADGEGHSKEEMLACFETTGRVAPDGNNLKQAIWALRQKLRPLGQDLIAQSYGTRVVYKRVRHLRSKVY